MAMEELQGVIQALVAGHQRDIERQRLQQSAAYQQSEIEDRKEQRKLQMENYRVQHEHERKMEDFQYANNELARFRELNNFKLRTEETGEAPAGWTASPLPGSPTHMIYSGPIGDKNYNYIGPKPEIAIAQQVVKNKALNQDKEDHQLMVMDYADQLRSEREAKRLANEKEIAEAKNKTSITLGQMRAAASRYSADHRSTANAPNMDEETVTDHLSNFHDGVYTLEQLEKIAPNKGNREMIIDAMNKTGSKFYNKVQQTAIPQFKFSAQTVPNMEAVQRVLTRPVRVPDGQGGTFDTDPKEALMPGTRSYMYLHKRMKQVKEGLVGSLPIFGQGSRPSNVRAATVTDAFELSAVPTADLANGQTIRQFKSLVGEQFDAMYGNLSPVQQQDLRVRLGMTGWGGGASEDNDNKKPTKPNVTHRFNPKTGIAEPVQQD